MSKKCKKLSKNVFLNDDSTDYLADLNLSEIQRFGSQIALLCRASFGFFIEFMNDPYGEIQHLPFWFAYPQVFLNFSKSRYSRISSPWSKRESNSRAVIDLSVHFSSLFLTEIIRIELSRKVYICRPYLIHQYCQ